LYAFLGNDFTSYFVLFINIYL